MAERDYLRAKVEEGLRKRYGDPPPAEAIERMDMELGVIDRMGFSAYFLIVWDFVKYAKDNGIAVGPGRGSAAGSLVAYCLNITDVDPLRYDLLFERFLNPERVSMPDIDIDFSVRGRERVMRYVTEKYGRAVGRADRHLRQDVPARGHARRRPRPRPRLRRRRPPGEAHPRPDHGPPAELRGLPGQRRPQDGLRDRRDREADHRRREGPRGDRPQQLDPRGRRRHRRPAADRHRPAPARRGGDGRRRQEGLPHRHPVLDEAGRGPRPAEDGLPRPAQPRRDRGRAGHHRALLRHPARHGPPAARRPEDLRDARPRRQRRRVPVRVRGHAGGAAEGPADRVRRPRRPRLPVPPGRDGPDPHVRPRQARPRAGPDRPTRASSRSSARPTGSSCTRSRRC